jgi:hypothetical protein
MANKWIQHVQSYASKNGINYRDALKDPKCKAAYKKGPSSMMKSSKKMRGGEDDETSPIMMATGGKKRRTKRCGKKRKGTRKR